MCPNNYRITFITGTKKREFVANVLLRKKLFFQYILYERTKLDNSVPNWDYVVKMDDDGAFSVLGMSYLIRQVYQERPQKMYAGHGSWHEPIAVRRQMGEPFFVDPRDYNQ